MKDHYFQSIDDISTLPGFILVLATVLIFLVGISCQSDSAQSENNIPEKAGVSRASTQMAAADYSRLVGRWLRPDGGYLLEIQKADLNGHIQAAYYNPRSINVSQALAAQKEGVIQLFVELQDVGYPGATYTLSYDPDNDILTGLYYQPAAGQTFDVQFVRKE